MLVVTNYVKHYASTNFQSLLVTCVSCSREVKNAFICCWLWVYSLISKRFFHTACKLTMDTSPLLLNIPYKGNNLTNLVWDNKFFTSFVSKTRLVRLL